MIRLIVNADDFGLTPGINAAILSLNRSTAVTSATLMATAAESLAAATASLAQPSLGVGCHVVLVDGVPALPPDQIRTLIGRDNAAFRPTLNAFITDLLLGRVNDAHIELEATAQIRRLQTLGVRVTHVDTHKHTHVFPRVLRPLIRAAMVCGVKAIRNPFEPQWSMDMVAGAGPLRKLQLKLLNTQRNAFLILTRQAAMQTTDGTLGILATGSLDKPTLRRILGEAGRGAAVDQHAGGPTPAPRAGIDRIYELCCHPGYQDAALDHVHTRLRESRDIEAEALADILTPTLTPRRIHYGDLH